MASRGDAAAAAHVQAPARDQSANPGGRRRRSRRMFAGAAIGYFTMDRDDCDTCALGGITIGAPVGAVVGAVFAIQLKK